MPRSLNQRGLPLAVIDNTLLSRLVDLELAESLPWVFKLILIPPEVKREAYRKRHGGRRRLRNLIRESSGFFVNCREVDPSIRDFLKADLDDGEAAAIAQADFRNAILLLDEERGFKRATRMQITVVRTLRLLNMLKEAGAISHVQPYHEKLHRLGFYMTLDDQNQLLREVGEL
jgi:predicted nucleic acid-binding protein